MNSDEFRGYAVIPPTPWGAPAGERAESFSKKSPRGSSEGPRKSPRGSQEVPGGPQEAPGGSQEVPRGPKRLPGSSKRFPRSPQELPKSSLRAPQEASRGSKRFPRGPKRLPRGFKRCPRGPERAPMLPKGRPKRRKIASKAYRFFHCIFATHFVYFLDDLVSPRTSKIVLPCARELNFQKIVILAIDTDLLRKRCDFVSWKLPKNVEKSMKNRCRNVKRVFLAPEAPRSSKNSARELQNVLRGGVRLGGCLRGA